MQTLAIDKRHTQCARRLLERGVSAAIVREALEDLIERAEIEALVFNAAGECRAKIRAECSNPAHSGKFGADSEKRQARDIDGGVSDETAIAADGQAQGLGYANLRDVEVQARRVEQAKINSIVSGTMKGRCKAHEGLAVLLKRPTIKAGNGSDIKLTNSLVEHYLDGKRRLNNEPKVENLCDLPVAIYAIKTDRNPIMKFPPRTTPDYLKPPKGTQRVYRTPTERGNMKAYAFVDSGVLSGWHIKK